MDLPPELEILRSSRAVGFGPHGFFQKLSESTRVYQQALVEKSFSVEQLAWLLSHGDAAGRVYAACLWRAIDAEAGEDALRGLLADDAELRFCVAGSCGIVPTTVAECARWLLAEAPKKAFPEQVITAEHERQREAQLRAREQEQRLRLAELLELNRRTAELIEASGGQPTCSHCGVRAAHRVVSPQPDGETYLVCSSCHRSFNARNAKE
jgi:hypothetical protein